MMFLYSITGFMAHSMADPIARSITLICTDLARVLHYYLCGDGKLMQDSTPEGAMEIPNWGIFIT
jgi:hypothetical protein